MGSIVAHPHVTSVSSLDEALRRLAETRDEALWRWLLNSQTPELARVARGILGRCQLADDAVQEAYLDLTRALARYRPGSDAAAAAWLRQMVRNKAREIRRREQTRERHEQLADEVVHRDDDERFDDQVRAHLREVLNALAAPHRQVLILRFYHRYDHATIGRLLAIEPVAARKRVERALRILRRRLRQRGVACSIAVLVGWLGRPASAAATTVPVRPLVAATSPSAGALAAATLVVLAGGVMLIAIAWRAPSAPLLQSHTAAAVVPPASTGTTTTLADFIAAFKTRHPRWRADERVASLTDPAWHSVGAITTTEGQARTVLAHAGDAWQRRALVYRGSALDLDRTALLLVAEVETVVRDGYSRFGLGYCGGVAPYPEGIMHRIGLAEEPPSPDVRERSYAPLDRDASIHDPQLHLIGVAFEPDGVRIYCNGRVHHMTETPRRLWRQAHPALSFDCRRLAVPVSACVRRLRVVSASLTDRDPDDF